MADSKAYSSLFDDDDFETEEDQDLDAELQRVVNDYQPPIRRRTEEGAKSAPQGSSDEFANEGNLDSCIAYLSTSLSAFGYPSDLPLRSGRAADSAKVCNLVYALLQQRQRDLERFRDSEEGIARMESSLGVAEQARQRMESRLLAKEKEIGGLENKLQTLEMASKAESSKLGSDLAELQKSNLDLQRRHVQFQHELRRKDKEFERLQAKLHDLLTEKNREAKANMDAASRFMDTGNRSTAPRRDDDLYKRIVASYEEKQREVLQENRDLRLALESLQGEHRAIGNQQILRTQQLNAVKKTVEQEFAVDLADLTPLGMEAKLRAKYEAIRESTAAFSIDIPNLAPSPQGQRGGKAGAGGGAVAEQLHTQVRGARRLLTDLEVLSRIAIDTLAGVLRSSRSSGAGGVETGMREVNSPSVRQLEEEYRAKVVELESKMATAHMQGQAVGKSEEGFRGEFEAERRRVDAARLALVEEKARIAKLLEQQGERLQQEAHDLGQARWEFENTRTAFQDTMRQFAPGFGAGTFLAKAIAKKSALAAQERRTEDGAIAAGKSAADKVELKGGRVQIAV